MHEQINVAKALRGKSTRQSLCMGDGIQDTILDRKHKALLLLRVRTNSNGGEKLPNNHILTSVYISREYVRKCWLEDVEERVEGLFPAEMIRYNIQE